MTENVTKHSLNIIMRTVPFSSNSLMHVQIHLTFKLCLVMSVACSNFYTFTKKSQATKDSSLEDIRDALL